MRGVHGGQGCDRCARVRQVVSSAVHDEICYCSWPTEFAMDRSRDRRSPNGRSKVMSADLTHASELIWSLAQGQLIHRRGR